jgi:serine protease
MNVTPACRRLRGVLTSALVLLALATTVVAPPARAAGEYNPWAHRLAPTDTDRVIVKLKASGRASALSAAGGESAAAATDRVAALGGRAGVAVANARNLWGDTYVARVDGVISVGGLQAAIEKLRADPEVEYAEPDARMHAHFNPSDPRASTQWYVQPVSASTSGQTVSATNAVAAWDVTQGSAGIVVAVIDTGVRLDHEDLTAKFLPGRDFVSGDSTGGTFKNANDGDGWDTDPSDPGDWVSATDLQDPVFSKCGGGPNEDLPTDSSWHGTRVSGIIGASTNNGLGIAGMGFNTKLLPLRVLGKCGGFSSDIIAAMRWAVGLQVSAPGGGVLPVNPNPAKILNLSLGGNGACPASYQNAVNEILALASRPLIIVSAGNDGSTVDEPANCIGVVSVGAVRHAGTKVGFSNLGSNLTLTAPGGNCVNTGAGQPCLFSIDTTTNDGKTTPGANGYTDQTNANVGTSFSAPIVSGAAALMYAVNGSLTAPQAIARLKSTARVYPVVSTVPQCRVPNSESDTQTSECYCTSRTCGAGMLDAGALIGGLNAPVAAFSTVGTLVAGSPVTLDASTSSGSTGASISTYAWSVRPGATGTPTFTSTTAQSTQLSLPSSGSLAVQLTVTDTLGRTATATQNILSAVPNLAGLTQAAAATALLNADLAMGLVSSQPNSTVPAGSIVSQNPASGTSVASGSVVGIVISTGPQQVAVPDVVNQTQAAATTTLTNAGLTVGTVTQQTSSTVASGNVISQSPAAGSTANSGSAVTLVVSTGPAVTGGGAGGTSTGGGGGGGGGGAMDPLTLALGTLLGLGALWGRRRREAVRRVVQDKQRR